MEQGRVTRRRNLDEVKANDSMRESTAKSRLRNHDNKRKEYLRQYELENMEMRAFLRKERREAKVSSRATVSVGRTLKSPALIREFFESLRAQLHISNYTDWYRISRPQIYQLGGMHRDFVLFVRFSH
jgi:hypothetical protein